MHESTSDRNSIEVLAEEFVERYRNGEKPPLSEYIQRYPEHAEEIQDLFPAMLMMENLKPDEEDEAAAQQRRVATDTLRQIGDYRIIREVGRGGMGIVYEAEQVSLGRHVALKVLPKELVGNRKQRSRFEREAKAAAKLHHTNIVPVFGVGEDDGQVYYVMQFIQGLALDEVLEELKRQKAESGFSGGEAPSGQLRVSRRSELVASVAQSLFTGGLQQTPSPLNGDAELASGGDETQILDSAPSAFSSAANPSTATGRLSDTFSVSDSSVVLPGSDRARSENSGKKQTYWHSIAQIGCQVARALDYAGTGKAFCTATSSRPTCCSIFAAPFG